VRCICSNESYITFNRFQKGGRCKACQITKIKYTFSYVKEYIEKYGFILLDKKYTSSNTKLNCICSNNHSVKISFSKFKAGRRCLECFLINKRHSSGFIEKYFKDNNCELLDKYKNAITKMKYRCSCGDISYTQFNHFQNGHRCRSCGFDKTSKSYIFKNYMTPNGTNLRIQGYENIVLDELFLSHEENEIITERRSMPLINYKINGITHRYFPDIYIKSENKIIEVKSNYTYRLCLIKNILKALATRKNGYVYEIWIYDMSKNLIII
jgi:hypothetical protein